MSSQDDFGGPRTDDELREIVGTGRADQATIIDVAHELLRARKRLRGDSRRAEQIRRTRWILENALSKIEDLSKFELSEDRVAGEISQFLETFEGSIDPRAVAVIIRAGGWR